MTLTPTRPDVAIEHLTTKFTMLDPLKDASAGTHIDQYRCELLWHPSPLVPTTTVAEATIYKVHPAGIADLFDALDDLGDDVAWAASHLGVDPSRLEFHLGKDHTLPATFLLVRNVTVTDEHLAGLGLDRVIVARAMDRLGRDANFAVMNPAAHLGLDQLGTAQHYAAVRKLTDPWCWVGFDMYAIDMLIADLLRRDTRDMVRTTSTTL